MVGLQARLVVRILLEQFALLSLVGLLQWGVPESFAAPAAPPPFAGLYRNLLLHLG